MSEDHKISFEKLYGDDKIAAVSLLMIWVNDWLAGADVKELNVDWDQAYRFVSNLRKSDVPAQGGFEKASPFKKASWLYVMLHTLNPFEGTLPNEVIGESLAKFSNSTVSLIGLSMVRECLYGAQIEKDGKQVDIENPINVSKHFLLDLVEASGRITPIDHFQTFSLLFEALAYEANPGLSYPKVL